MTQIKPFKAVLYNTDKIVDMSKVVCPPYDVISETQQNTYYSKSENNFIRIMLGQEKEGDDKKNNKYTRAKETFDRWLKEGVLILDDKPCVYFYKQEYTVMGQRHSRTGIISLMQLPENKDSRVFPHENTHSEAKEDRLKLWRSLSANLSCIFVCFSDQQRRVEKVFNSDVAISPAFIDVVDADGVRHLLWKLSDQDKVKQVVDTLSHQPLFIADGHHRYEVAKKYRDIRKAKVDRMTGEEPFNYVMTYFTNMDSRDLQIFPMHRILKQFPADTSFLDEFFRIDKVKTKDDLLILLAKAGKNEHSFGLYTKEGIKLLRLKNKLLIDKYVKEGSPEYRRLDATILKNFVFDRVGVQSEDIVYTKDFKDVVDMVGQGSAQAGFVMNAVKIQQLKDIALNGERMPPKTTYFYPKVLSGLTAYKIT